MSVRARVITAAGVVSVCMLLGSSAPAGAGKTPSVTIVMVCDRGVPPTSDGSLRGIYNIGFQAAGGSSVGFGSFMECPADGGRVRARVTTSAAAASGGFSCWNGIIQVGSHSGSLPLKADCVDAGVRYATITVR